MVKHMRTHWAPYHLGRQQTELLRQKDNGQFLPSREHLWMHQCWVEEGWKSAPVISKAQSCLTMCVQGKPQNWCLFHGAKCQDKKHRKRSSFSEPKQELNISPFSQSRREQGPVAGDPAAAGRCLQRQLPQKKANTEKAVARVGTGTGDS